MKLSTTHIKNISIYIMSLLYILVGIKHFSDPNFFLKIMPKYLNYHLELVYLDFSELGEFLYY